MTLSERCPQRTQRSSDTAPGPTEGEDTSAGISLSVRATSGSMLGVGGAEGTLREGPIGAEA